MAGRDGTDTTPKAARGNAAQAEELSYNTMKAWLDEAPKQEPWSIHARPLPTKGLQNGQGTQLQMLENDMKRDLDRLKREEGFRYRA